MPRRWLVRHRLGLPVGAPPMVHVRLAVQLPGFSRVPSSVQPVKPARERRLAAPPHHWQFDARAVKLTRAIALDGKWLRTKCEKDHDLG